MVADHLVRSVGAIPQGLERCSMFSKRFRSSSGNWLFIWTRCRRSLMILGICSISTGQASMQAPQVVQDQMASSVLVPSPSSPTRGSLGAVPFLSSWRLASRLVLMVWMICRGLSGLLVACAGQASWQRPHSVQEKESSRSFQVKSVTFSTP